MKTKNLIYLFALTIMIISCSSSSSDDLMEIEQESEPTAITYNSTIQPIISNNCNNCHGSPTRNGAPTSYTTYTQVRNDINDIISRINDVSNPMPTSGLMSQSLRDQIQQWLDEGLLED